MELNDFFSKGIKFNALRIKSTYLVSILYSLLSGRLSGRFEAFRRVSACWWSRSGGGGGGGGGGRG